MRWGGGGGLVGPCLFLSKLECHLLPVILWPLFIPYLSQVLSCGSTCRDTHKLDCDDHHPSSSGTAI